MNKVNKEMDALLEDVIKRRLEVDRDGGYSFVDILLEIHNRNADGDSIDRDDIKTLLMVGLIAGTDTVSAALEWVMTELLHHPNVMEKLQNEVREIVKDKEDISDDDLGKMSYMKAVIKETLRYHPPAAIPVPRIVREDVKIKGYDLSKGTVVMVNVWAIGRDPMCWDEPEKFKPERFLNHLTDPKELNFGWIPFGGGRRGCPGMTYSMATIEFVIANILHKFDWKLPNGVVLDMTECGGIVVHRPATPLVAVASKTT